MCSKFDKVLLMLLLVVISEVGLVCCKHHHAHQHGHRKRHRSQQHHPVELKPTCTEESWGIDCSPMSSPCSWSCPPGPHESPICGSDGLLYDSRCILEKEACLLRQKRVARQQFGRQSGPSLDVDESGRKCVHFLEPLNHGGGQRSRNQFQSGTTGNGESADDITTTTTHSVTNEPLEGESGLMEGIMMQNDQDPREEKVCDKEGFEVFKETLFSLTASKWESFRTSKEGKTSPKWRQLLADGPELKNNGPEADKDHLIQLIFSSLDSDSNFVLNYAELYQGDLDLGRHPIPSSSPATSCQWRDFLRFQDSDGDDKIHVTEFYAAFSHLYGVTMISLEKALEWKKLDAFQGSDLEIYCDVLGSPPTPVVWTTPTPWIEEDPHVIHELGGAIRILGVREQHGGNYSCKSVRNEEVVQHILVVVHKIGGDEVRRGFKESNEYEDSEEFGESQETS